MALFKAISLLLLLAGAANCAIPSLNTEELEQQEATAHLRQSHRALAGDKENGKNGAVVAGKDGAGGAAGGTTGTVNTQYTSLETWVVYNRAYTDNGVPVTTTTLDCSGTDKILEEFATYTLTESKCGIQERAPCNDASAVTATKKNNYKTSEKCIQGTCPGCCREYDDFVDCDEDGRFIDPSIPCLCHAGTFGGNPFDPNNVPSVPEVNTDPAAGCSGDWWGYGLGVKPVNTPADLPVDLLSKGECYADSHCIGASGSCCVKGYCLCGSPDATRSNCRG